jgi:predicted AlkP superfamily phosphohydrolase/phosphomutase
LHEPALDTLVNESYNSSAIFGLPDTIPDKPVVQVLTHGLGNDTLVIALKDATHSW